MRRNRDATKATISDGQKPLGIPQSLEVKIANQDSLLLTYDNLKVFLGGPPGPPQRGNYVAARFLYYGANDLERFHEGFRDGLPEEFYQSITAAERAALFIGDGRLKYNPDISMRQIREKQLESMTAAELVSILVGIGWGYQGVREFQKLVDAGYKHQSGGLIKTVDALPPEVQARVKNQLLRSRAISQTMNSYHYDFCDSNAEGSEGYVSAKNYLMGTAAHMKLVHDAIRGA